MLKSQRRNPGIVGGVGRAAAAKVGANHGTNRANAVLDVISAVHTGSVSPGEGVSNPRPSPPSREPCASMAHVTDSDPSEQTGGNTIAGDRVAHVTKAPRGTTALRIGLLVGTSIAVGLINAAPMAAHQGLFSQPGLMRLVIGGLCGLILSPPFCLAGWGLSIRFTTPLVTLPPLSLGLVAAGVRLFGMDETFFFTQLPAIHFMLLPVAVMGLRIRRPVTPHLCPNCGYDRRGQPRGVCSECGVDPGDSSSRARSIIAAPWRLASFFVLFIASSVVQYRFVTFLLSLG